MCSGSHDVEFLAKLGSAKEHMTGRIDDYVATWNRGDLDAAMDTFIDEGLDYTDYGVMRFHMDKPTLRTFFSQFSQVVGDLKIQTVSVHGAHDFCVWESLTEFTVLVEMEEMPFKKGERATLVCASLIWWNMEGKIVKEVDFAAWKQ